MFVFDGLAGEVLSDAVNISGKRKRLPIKWTVSRTCSRSLVFVRIFASLLPKNTKMDFFKNDDVVVHDMSRTLIRITRTIARSRLMCRFSEVWHRKVPLNLLYLLLKRSHLQ